MAFKSFRVAQMLDTEERRLSYLNAVLEDGDVAEIKRAFKHVAESKGVELPALEGDFWLLPALKKLGFKLQALELPKTHTA
ncbi:hypothetical protein HBZC1_17830 [Helicobacter bizzozeronii CIII-1]|uniref:Uncharacterized protein n=1 Tax=Helicobacter bizzozeronii (strain CIII-1) TaxID=1002804 RepID=F8KPN8_HELBC|nr:hypothetical protein [Helicobacter bizzozeronii]CCB80769.1 hypothetical protein HBZC1_17830 [Helicobacter bizzozeronii CIII-1]